MGDGVRLVGLALLLHAVGPVVHGLVGPVEVAAFQGLPGLFGLRLPGGDELPDGGHVEEDAVIDMGR